MFILLIVLFYTNIVYGNNLNGDSCVLDSNKKGTCSKILNCHYATLLIKQRKRPVPCGFEGVEPIVCCPEGDEYAINPHGNKSRKFCFTYGQPMELMKIAGGRQATPKEYPHMAILGITQNNEIDWLCGGTLISFQYVLTAAHCLYHKSFGLIQWARLGELDLSTEEDDAEPHDYKIIEHHGHPEYDGILHYHDIAVIKLSETVSFNFFIRPACLFTAATIPGTEMTASGWGATKFGGDRSSQLLTVKLNIFKHAECNSMFPAHVFRKVPRGIDNQIQICAGARNVIGDTCEGDSGGPLQVVHTDYNNDNVYGIVGVTSFGRACGTINHPGVYVRIYPYIQWIESIVWNEQ